MTRRLVFAFFILLIIFCISSVGYPMVEGMNFFGGFYMIFITLTTIGVSELTTLSAGRNIVDYNFISGDISYIVFQTIQSIFENEFSAEEP
jgi:hypothetical protein